MSNSPASGYGLSTVTTGAPLPAPVLDYLPRMPRAYRPKVGLVGCGGISEYHLRAYRDLGLDVVALCDCNPARAEKRRREFYPEATVLGDYRDLFARPDIEVVDLALHPDDRVSAIEAALQAGKHVLSQKPFVTDLEVGRRLVDLAQAKGLKLAVNQNGRWAPHFAYLTAAVEAGLIGDVSSVDFALQWDHTWTKGTPFEQIHHLVLYDFGIHWFDLAGRLVGGRPARRVWASAERAGFQSLRPPLLAHAVIDYAGAQVRMTFNGQVTHGQEDRTSVCGSLGTLRSFGPSLSDQTVTLHTAAGRTTAALEGTWFTHGFRGTMAELLCAIEEDREPRHNARENLDSLALCFAALHSADTGVPVVPGAVVRFTHAD